MFFSSPPLHLLVSLGSLRLAAAFNRMLMLFYSHTKLSMALQRLFAFCLCSLVPIGDINMMIVDYNELEKPCSGN